jgi:ribose-phosphate pyrophosphokinase
LKGYVVYDEKGVIKMTNDNNKYSQGDLGIISLSSCTELGNTVCERILDRRKRSCKLGYLENYDSSIYKINIEETRFSNGEGKIKLLDSVRCKDVYVFCDIGNYSCTYNMYGFTNHMGPDEHFQDLKRTLSAMNGKAGKVTLIMPLMYESRQHKRNGRESLDCAIALKELEQFGVNDIITFDVHDRSIQNAIPNTSFDSIYPTYYMVKALVTDEPDIFLNLKNLIVISPDTGAMDRAIYYSGIMGVDIGMFYKRRDYSKLVNGKNPIVAHEYVGREVEGKDVLIVDDMIASGESVFDIAVELKKRKANKIFISATFALFTEGADKFDKYYKEGIIDRVYSTNLTYVSPEIRKSEWFMQVDMSKYLAKIIDFLNQGLSISPIINDSTVIKDMLKR